MEEEDFVWYQTCNIAYYKQLNKVGRLFGIGGRKMIDDRSSPLGKLRHQSHEK